MGKKSRQKRRVTRRTMRKEPLDDQQKAHLRTHTVYEGVPYHKRSPGDFGLTPPAAPRKDKTLCDKANISKRAEADALLKRAVNVGLASVHEGTVNFPKQLWVVDDSGQVFEAMHGGSCKGAYHGYPVRRNDPFFDEVVSAWKKANV